MVKRLIGEKYIWSSTRISTRTTLILNIHKWSSWWNKLIIQNSCWWNILFLKKIYDIHKSAIKLNDDLEKISYWAYHWKIHFNPDPVLPRNALLTIYKNFVRPYLDYGDILYDKPNNENFQNNLEKVQYRACLTITVTIQGTSRTKLYDELGLHSLIKNYFYKIVNGLLISIHI